ncbi:MAG: recombination mediator RecR [Pseudomonadota bacterium]
MVDSISRLPGLGRRSARRIVLHLISRKEQTLEPLLSQLSILRNSMVVCEVCGNIDLEKICSICADQNREQQTLCVVENISDLWAIERSGNYRGRYHVLGGVLSAIDGIGPERLNIASLVKRVESQSFNEVIIATNPTIDGRTTSHYLSDLLKSYSIKISRLGYGVPIGGELDYLDESTLQVALATRTNIANKTESENV